MKNIYCMKIHETSKGKLIAACDFSLLGKSFSETINGIEISLDLKKDFYFESKVSLSKIIEKLKEVKMANFVGNNLINSLIV